MADIASIGSKVQSPLLSHLRSSSKRSYDLAIKLLNLPPEWDDWSYYLTILTGECYIKTKTYKVKKKECGTIPVPKWTINLDL